MYSTAHRSIRGDAPGRCSVPGNHQRFGKRPAEGSSSRDREPEPESRRVGLDNDQTASDLDQTGSDADQTASDADQTSAERDQAGSDADRRASKRDQAASDRDFAAQVPASDDLRHAHEESLVERRETNAARDETSVGRARTASERFATAARRDETARLRDLAAEARDHAAAERDHAEETAHHLKLSQETVETLQAESRARASADRGAAARDRAQAARDRELTAREREQTRRDLELAHLDELTGVYRRSLGNMALQHELDRAERSGKELVLAFVDVNGLKQVNDRHGHAAGDALLRDVTTAIRSKLRSYDPIVRYGGDEFVCAMPDTGLEDARRRFDEISGMLAETHGDDSISVGLAVLRPGESLKDLTARGDQALYEARVRV
jgi:diguanylate cyclase (GGDEF)-like protein